jgi:CIC family chloride channel protein
MGYPNRSGPQPPEQKHRMSTVDQVMRARAPERSLLFMMAMAIATGVVAGVGAWGFRMLIGLVHNVLFLGEFTFAYDANLHTPPSPWGAGVVLVPVVGALVVAWLVGNFAPEAKGHGVPEVMDAIHYHQGRIRPRVAVVKSLASAISIGSGGSVGREGPIVQIGSAFGSTLGEIMPMATRDRITLIAAGAGAGIAATFNAPLGGVAFAIELLLVAVNARSLVVVATASAFATHISRLLLGARPSFYIPALEMPDFYLTQPWGLAAFFVLGGLMGLLSVAFIRGLYGMEDLFETIPGNYYTRHMLGMLGVGAMMFLLLRYAGHYYVQGVGYATIMDILQGPLGGPWFLLLLVALKLLATCLSLGSGASGGVFSPALFMGAAGGAAFGHLCQVLIPGLDIDMPTFAIAGMAATIGGTTGAVLTGIIMITEMTQDNSVVLPLVITGSMAYAVRKLIMDESIYTMKLRARGHAVPEGLQAALLNAHRVRDLMESGFVVADAGGKPPADASIVVLAEDGMISGVARQPAARGGRSGAADPARSIGYVVVDERKKLLAAIRAMWDVEAEVILASRRPASGRVDDIVGIVTPAALASLLKAEEDLL